jgi:SIR2-like domain
MSEFQDQVHIERLRDQLWADRNIGHAAVMVGAGFSRNARKVSTASPPCVLWTDLAERMFADLYPSEGIRRASETSRSRRQLNMPRIAGEYEAAFGRGALEELIQSCVPDHLYVPGLLHTLLLRLPWSDIFTTNYDTLLERTRATVFERRYELIQATADIPGRSQPRIVKLHGSLPSNRPFIITEEDYRTYPACFPAFVNLVQQSIMESTLCLIGFSGDDPNFLNWIGWVRDNLGKQRRSSIYAAL